jgi:uncharacterized integral membrane protein
MQIVKTVLFVLLFMVLLVVMIQNAQPITFRFLNWTYQVSQLLLVTIVLILGFVVGFIVAKTTGGRKKDEPTTAQIPR